MSSPDNNQQEYGQDLNINAIVTTGIAFALITAIVIMYLYGLYLRSLHAEEVRKAPGLTDEVFALKQAQQIDLATSGWIDAEAGIARIPIDEAIENTVEKYAADSHSMPAAEEPTADEDMPADAEGETEQPAAGGGGEDLAGRPRE